MNKEMQTYVWDMGESITKLNRFLLEFCDSHPNDKQLIYTVVKELCDADVNAQMLLSKLG